ncbi:hypothetical protein A9Q74_09250 [Colwellia sp. 39_35_sub15_T18]|nr:hypothetical protein A9Q74_09250 [Colwellia sp. 39_35_sub15_T18]
MLKLPSELTIAQVEEYRVEVQAIIDENEVITIDDSKLARIDTIGVQFILAVVTYILAQGKTLQYQSTSTVLQESIKQLGINDAILMQHLPN